MEQDSFAGFGPTGPGVVQWRTPINQPPSIVALCRDQAHAVRLSLDHAKKRYGAQQCDVAALMEVQKGRLSEWRSPGNTMPEKHRARFARATGCNLLQQHIEDVEARKRASGDLNDRERDAVIVELMAHEMRMTA